MKETVERLQMEKRAWAQNARDEGAKEARDWLKEASYMDLLEVMEVDFSTPEELLCLDETKYLKEVVARAGFDTSRAYVHFCSGFLLQVEQVCDSVEGLAS